MATNLARLELFTPDERSCVQPRTRKVARRKVTDSFATIFSTRGEIAARIKDISIQGCSVSFSIGELRMGQFIQIGMNGHDPVTGIIRWVNEGTAGIEFLAPLTWAIAAQDSDEF